MAEFFRSYNPIWNLRDLTGLPLDDNYYVFFLENVIPYQPQAVYHTSSGTPWTNPVQVTAAGTLPIDVFFDPDLVYRIEIRQGDQQSDPLIWLIENYVPSSATGDAPITDASLTTDNQITNPQFSLINFESPYTQTFASDTVIDVAPGWDLVLVGSGSVTLTRVPLSTQNPTNAPYSLNIETSGSWTQVYLRQRFQESGMLWATKSVSSALMARVDGASQEISAALWDSKGAELATVLNPVTIDGNYEVYLDSGQLPEPNNNDVPPDAYIEYRLSLPTTSDIFVTSFQLVQGENAFQYPYDQETIQRQQDHTFHYYKPQLEEKPIPSHLVGWDFPLNPAQFNGSTQAASAIGANASKYVWDQTIIYQTTDSGVGISRGTAGELVVTAAQNTQAAVVQYLPAAEAREILRNKIAVNIAAKASTDTVASVSLWYTEDAALPDIDSNLSIVGTVESSNGKPIAAGTNGTWVEIPRRNDEVAEFTIETSATTNFNDYNFNGWDLEGAAGVDNATFFAIVIGTESMLAGQTVNILSVGLCSGDIATRPAPQTASQVLEECQYYFEKSAASDASTYGGAIANSVLLNQADGFDTSTNRHEWYRQPIALEYKTEKIVAPATDKFILYDVYSGGTADQLNFTIYNGNAAATSSGGRSFVDSGGGALATARVALASTQWTETSLGKKRATLLNNVTTFVIRETALASHLHDLAAAVEFHYTIDTRLGTYT